MKSASKPCAPRHKPSVSRHINASRLCNFYTKECSPMRRATSMHCACVIFTLKSAAQCAAPDGCAAPMTQCAASLKFAKVAAILLFGFNTTFLLQMNSLNITNGLYTKDFNFSLIKTHFVMFAFNLLLKLCFWAVCFIFAFGELNALAFCLPCR